MSNLNLFDLSGRVAVVTGGSKGLGKAMARGFAQAGADVVISSRHTDELEKALPRNSGRHRPARSDCHRGPLQARRCGASGQNGA